MTDPMTPPPTVNRRDALTAEIVEIGREGFREGYSAAADQLAAPIAATWLASESGLPEERCRDLLAELRQILINASARGRA